MSEEKNSTQMALEYLLTYGWALVLIATLITVLVFVGTGNINVNTCSNFLQFICKGIGADGDTLVLLLQNSSAQKITINPFFDIGFDNKVGYAIITYKGNDYQFENVTIDAGEEFTISAKGMAHAEEISITYTERRIGLRKTVTSTINTDAPETIELSNDGVDNDGDGFVDCAAIDTTNCQYAVEADSVTGTEITFPGQTIQVNELRGTSGSIVSGDWKVETALLSFYVEEIRPNAQARVVFSGNTSSGEPDLVLGWNIIEVDLAAAVEFTGGNIPDFILRTQAAGTSFTINGSDKMPIAYLVVNPPEIASNGLDDDGDGLVDCNDPDVSDCVYINDAETVSDPIVLAGGPGNLIEFGELKTLDTEIVIEGTWETNVPIISFWAESFEPGAIYTLTIDGSSSLPMPVALGVNSQAIFIVPPATFSGNDAPDVLIQAQVGDITINNTDEMPVAIWIVNQA